MPLSTASPLRWRNRQPPEPQVCVLGPPVAGQVSPLLSQDSQVRPGSKKSAEVLLVGQPPLHRHSRISGNPWLTAMGVSAVIPRPHHRHPRESGDPWLQPWGCLPSFHVRTPGGRIGVASFK